MSFLLQLKESLLHLAFPHICEGCGSDALPPSHALCTRCLATLPETHFHRIRGNPVERIFWGRLPIDFASAQYYFTRDSVIQRLMHGLKYEGQKELGLFLGRMMGQSLLTASLIATVDALVPLPLHPAKEQKRGYNQATVLCEGMAEVLKKPVLRSLVGRKVQTETQTKKGRAERWNNMDGKFALRDPSGAAGRHLLLVDDVLTTGATIEACGRALLEGADTRLSVATLCISGR